MSLIIEVFEFKFDVESSDTHAVLLAIKHSEHRNQERHRQIMAALDNLTAAVTGLTGAVDKAVTEITTPHVNDAQAQAAADTINAQAERLNTAVASVNPPTPPTP